MEATSTDVVVIGAGPGGYAAAFYAADLGRRVVLVDRDARLGGVCMNRGCIPSKALLNSASLIQQAREGAHRGIAFGEPAIDVNKLRAWKNSIVEKLGAGIASLAKMRGVTVVTGRGHFEDSSTLRVETVEGQRFFRFEKAVIAVGSRPAMPGAFDLGNPRVMTSTEALEVPDIPEALLVIGGGYIGMELGTVYAALGTKVTVIEATDAVLAGADPDLIRPVLAAAKKSFKEIRLKAKVKKMSTVGKQIKVISEYNGQVLDEQYDRVLVSVGRAPNGQDLGLENTRVERDERGFVKVNERMQTADPNIYAIGDISGGVLLAHKASKEARIAIDNLTGENSAINRDIIIPAVVFTDPEVAWCGLTETEAKAKGIAVQVTKYPWGASARALTYDRPDGLTKLVIDPESERILGVGIVGHGAGELISEAAMAIEMAATAHDLAAVVHPHPTLSETLMEAAEVFYGHSAHYYRRKAEAPPREPAGAAAA